jgi:hypothetical protein
LPRSDRAVEIDQQAATFGDEGVIVIEHGQTADAAE